MKQVKAFLTGMGVMFFVGWLVLALLQESGNYPSGEMVYGTMLLLLIVLVAVEFLIIASYLVVHIVAAVVILKPTVGEWIAFLTFVCLCIAAQQWGASMPTGALAVAWAIAVMIWITFEDSVPELNRQVGG